jgi:hypothetical protein
MELELMNIFHLYIDDMLIAMRVNCTKKQLTDELKAYASVEPSFRQVKFKTHMIKKGYKFYYEGR